jgi:hypothetical protein
MAGGRSEAADPKLNGAQNQIPDAKAKARFPGELQQVNATTP